MALVDIVEYIVCRELHTDGDYHLHCYLKLADNLRTRNPRHLDLSDGDLRYHGNYQGARSIKNVVRYVTKESDYISNMDVASMLKRESDRAIIAKKIVHEKQDLEEVIKEHPHLIFGYARLKLDIKTYQADQEKQVVLPDQLDTPWGFPLELSSNEKQRHYWIYSTEPNMGKTTFGLKLQRDYRGVFATGDTNYWGVTRRTPFILLDEYNTKKYDSATLNQLCDGTFNFRVFQVGPVQLDRYTVLVLSNVPYSRLYPDLEDQKRLKVRFIEKCIDPISTLCEDVFDNYKFGQY